MKWRDFSFWCKKGQHNVPKEHARTTPAGKKYCPEHNCQLREASRKWGAHATGYVRGKGGEQE